MMVSDIEVNSAALLLQTKYADNTGCLYSNVLLGDWTAERVSTVSSVRCVSLSKGKAIGYRPLRVGIRTLKARNQTTWAT